MTLLDSFQIIVPIVIITLVGFLFARWRRVDLKTLADLVIYLTAPALALSQLSLQRWAWQELLQLAGAACFVILGGGLAIALFGRLTGRRLPDPLYLPAIFMNSGFIGYPLALFAFGSLGLGKAVVFDITNAILIFTLGIYLVSKGRDRWQLLKMPFLYAAALGLFLSFSGWKMPQYLFTPLYMLGSMSIPLALFLLGCRLASVRVPSWRLPLLASVLRLGLGLLLGLAAVLLFRLTGVTAKVVILLSSLSSAVTTIALAEEYEQEPDLIAATITLSTLLSFVLTVALLYWLARLTI